MVTPGAEARLRELSIALPPSPTPFGAYVECRQIGSLLFLTGMLPVIGHEPAFFGRVGDDLTVDDGHEATRIATLSGLASVRAHLGSLDAVRSIAKLGVYIATSEDFRDHPKVADGASELLRDVFGEALLPPRVVLGVATVPLGMPVEVELIFEIGP